ncbi:MAG TPA: hypothetical protein VEB70_05190 [Noviherbaspirillum sp.]|nr:hypothetical protein [Noviherbaspirillum sp.]
MAHATIAEQNTASALRKLLDDLRDVQGRLPNLVRAAQMLIIDDDELQHVDTVLDAAIRYSNDANWIAEEIEKTVIQQEAENDAASTRVDLIPLFGSQKLTRAGDTSTWIFSTSTTTPKKLTRRESMLINAALRAAGGQ